MKVHYYGQLDSLESCYSFQEFNEYGVNLFLQNSTRFGYQPATMIIKDTALFIKKNGNYYRFVVEDYEVEVCNGYLLLQTGDLHSIIKAANHFI